MSGNQKIRIVFIYKHYFSEFFEKQSQKVKDKILWTFRLVEDIRHVPESYLKHIEGTEGLYEIRAQTGNDIFRIFCFFDKENLVIIMNGFQKKSQKTPRQEISKALKIKAEYETEKK